MESGSTSNDLFGHLVSVSLQKYPFRILLSFTLRQLDEEDVEKQQPPMAQVMSDSSTAILAGSDTTSTVLCTAFYHLMRDPEVLKRLREEVDEAFPHGEPLTSVRLKNLPYLNAVM